MTDRKTARLLTIAVIDMAKPNTVDAGALLTLTAKVKSKMSGGSVTFWVNGVQWGDAMEPRNGKAKLVTASLPVGEHIITANYSGDVNNSASFSPAARIRIR